MGRTRQGVRRSSAGGGGGEEDDGKLSVEVSGRGDVKDFGGRMGGIRATGKGAQGEIFRTRGGGGLVSESQCDAGIR